MTATTTSTRPWERDGSIHLDSFDDIAVERAMEGWRGRRGRRSRALDDDSRPDRGGRGWVHRELCARWPGRARAIESLVRALGGARDDHPPMYVHGPPVTGKTSIVLRSALIARDGRRSDWRRALTEHAPRLLYEAVVEELRNIWRRRVRRCERRRRNGRERRSSVTGLATLWIFSRTCRRIRAARVTS